MVKWCLVRYGAVGYTGVSEYSEASEEEEVPPLAP